MAKHEFEWYTDEADRLITRDDGLRELQEAMDRMSRLDYRLPAALENLEWMRTVRTTAPYDAVRAGTRVLSGNPVRLRIDPVSVYKAVEQGPDSDLAKAKANEWECVLNWQMDLASQRRGIFRDDVTRSAVMYDEIVGQIIHLPTQIKSVEAIGGSTKRYDAASTYGKFAILLKNPQTVHVRYSDFMPEAVLSASVMPAQAIVDFWGDKAKELAKLISDDEIANDESYIVFDYCDYDSRCVWIVPGEDEHNQDADKRITIMEPTDNDLPFLPWVAVVGGTNLAAVPEDQRFPLLYGVYKAEQWITANIIGSMAVSQGIAEMSQPKLVIEGPQADQQEIDYTTPGGVLPLKPGHKAQQLTQQPLNPALREAYDRFVSDMARSTVPSILVSAEAMPGEAFAGFNMRVQQAMGALLPYKQLGERFYAGLFRQMLLWTEYSGEPLRGYGEKKAAYEINDSDIDPASIYLSCEITADVPLDRMQKINSAVMMSRELKYPAAKILEELGETDPQRAMEDWEKEQLTLAELEGRKQMILAGYQLEVQKQQMALQMQAQNAQMQMQQQNMMAQQQAQQAQTGQPNQQPMPGGVQGMPATQGGQGFNPAMSGQPAAMAGPLAATREAQTGQTRGGENVNPTGP